MFKIETQKCSQYDSCQTCLESNDPFCGWCSLENKCSVRSKCLNNDDETRWLSSHGDARCSKIISMLPSKIQKGQSVKIKLEVENLPNVRNETYKCVFRDASDPKSPSRQTVAEKNGKSVSCLTPEPNLMPDFPTGSG
ncbi:DgyrCDS14163 [Dimorphilus gyrociliatus]|uniref:DgyrCDS14163 n=1 Tax=Dimorphilus gyrociliatus TaxID=2664684 RepID=A0A7I8WD56_9ANNE|nr:DgyrCDS14163 [Dimorphilus gyrociliatus]